MIRFTKTVEPAATDPAKLEKDRTDAKAKPAAAKKRPAPASIKPAGDDDKLL